jgi:hypothetical protein
MVIRPVMEVVNNQVTITLPKEFKGKKQVLVILDDQVGEYLKKLELMKLAADDPLFLADLQAVQEDFSIIDNEQP